MKPKAPKRKDPTPNCKTGEVSEVSVIELYLDWTYLNEFREMELVLIGEMNGKPLYEYRYKK